MCKVITVHGGLTAEPMHAVVAGAMLSREAGEALNAFEGRAVAAAEAGGARLVVIGGLPDGEQIGGAEAEADALAETILTAAEPDAGDCAALADLVTFAARTGLFTPSPCHLAALELVRGAAG